MAELSLLKKKYLPLEAEPEPERWVFLESSEQLNLGVAMETIVQPVPAIPAQPAIPMGGSFSTNGFYSTFILSVLSNLQSLS